MRIARAALTHIPVRIAHFSAVNRLPKTATIAIRAPAKRAVSNRDRSIRSLRHQRSRDWFMFGHALTLAGIESLALYLILGLAIASALVATLLLIGQLAATARSRDGGTPMPGSSLSRFLAGLGFVLAAVAVLQLLSGSGLAEAARSTLAGLRSE
jgi:hypothetical protein